MASINLIAGQQRRLLIPACHIVLGDVLPITRKNVISRRSIRSRCRFYCCRISSVLLCIVVHIQIAIRIQYPRNRGFQCVLTKQCTKLCAITCIVCRCAIQYRRTGDLIQLINKGFHLLCAVEFCFMLCGVSHKV